MPNNDQYSVRTVCRAISILQAFIDGPGEYSLTDISRKARLNQSTAYRLITTLMDGGFLEQSPGNGKYRLGVSALALGDAYLRHNDLFQRAHPKLIELRDRCGETVHLTVLEGKEVVYLDKLPGLHPIGLMSSRVGGRAPAYCTGVGKALLAFQTEKKIRSTYRSDTLIAFTPNTITSLDRLTEELAKIRVDGFALDREEHENGVACIAVPIFDQKGILAAISLSGPSDRIVKDAPNLSQLAVGTAREISTLFGGFLNPNSIAFPPSQA
jgi:DNA-binding IclR family transcriptional regulator